MEKRNVHLIRGKYTYKQRFKALEPRVIASGAINQIAYEHPEYKNLVTLAGIEPGHTHYIITID